jgi:hypothetical protein
VTQRAPDDKSAGCDVGPDFRGLPPSFRALFAGTLVNRVGGFVVMFVAIYLTEDPTQSCRARDCNERRSHPRPGRRRSVPAC